MITQTIKHAVLDWLDSENLESTQALNAGLCADFANALMHLPGVEVCGIYDVEDAGSLGITDAAFMEALRRGAIGHTFIRYQGRFYDAERPDGVDCPTSLPTFNRAIDELV